MSNRREFLALAGLASAGLVSPARASLTLDFANPADNLYGLIKLMADLSGQRRFWVQPGRIYAFQEGKLAEPILNYTGCTVRSVRRISDIEYQSRYRGWMLMQDPLTDEVIDEWSNPITGELNEVAHFATWVGKRTFTDQGVKYSGTGSAQFTWFDRPFVLPWQVLDDDVWCPFEQFSIYTDPAGNKRYEKAIHTYHGKLSDLENPELTMARSTIASQSQSLWFPWMKMERVSGHMILRSLGKKYESADGLMPWLVEELDKRYPGGLTDPFEWD